MKKWWLDVGWPWLKENWWVLLILPLIALTAIASSIWNKSVISLVDPLRGADERAREEHARRIQALEQEKADLQKRLEAIQKENAALQRHMEERLEARIADLRNDPEKLRQAMLEAGRR